MALPFGETLPHGSYTVYVDVNGEIAKRNAIYKEQMKTPAVLQVVVGRSSTRHRPVPRGLQQYRGHIDLSSGFLKN